MSIITLNHPDGSVRLDVPGDVAIGELMPELLEVTGQPDRPHWTLSTAGAQICPADKTLVDLGIADGSALALHTAAVTNGATVDMPTGVTGPPPLGIAATPRLAASDQILLVADGEPDTASLVAEAAQYLKQHAPPLVLVANKLDRSSRVDVDALEREIAFARGIVRVPISRTGAEQLHASHFSWTHAPTCWTTPLRKLAALLVSDWRRLDIAE